jgi:2-methylcitrate dehydratase PrpD
VTTAQRLARFVAGLTLDAIPEPVAGRAALLALDTLGNGLAAAGEDFGRAALDVAEQLGGRPESALLGRAVRVAAANAVLAKRDGIKADAVTAIRCRTSAGPVPRLWEPLAAKHAPPNGYAAKFSLPYLLATIFVRGHAGLAEFTDAAVRDPDVLRLASRVTYEIDPTIDYPRQFVGDVEVTLADGRRLRERQDRPRGGPDAPLSRAEIEAKFRGNAGLALPAARADAIVRAVSRLAAAPSLSDLIAALTPERSR